ncbi:MAG: helix-turn-helix domain-containing protein [Pseudomonadota bacterium]
MTDTGFAAALKDWRRRRRMSQLDLGLTSDVSARHISFLETGRARPSRSMVLRLCETLDVPRPARNTLLNAAGFAPAYRSRDLDTPHMDSVRQALVWTLDRHDPYPALALDRHWTLVRLNRAAARLLSAAGLAAGDSLLQALLDPNGLPSTIANWPEVAHHLSVRLRTESAHYGGDTFLEEAASALAEAAEPFQNPPSTPLPAIIATRYRLGEIELALFSTLAQFGTAEDMALAELKIELLFPDDEATRLTLEQLASAGS